uniref:Uncharacterized protein n=1 Tax=Alexandrium catenella TaxID=2925 RepID=A0A7S1LNB5_ALECA
MAAEEDATLELYGCSCDECARKALLLQRLEAGEELPMGATNGQQQPRAEVLREELISHSRLAKLAPQDNATGDRLAIRKPNPKRPWLTYDPDALLPNPFDSFLLGGGCPTIVWPSANSIKERSKLTIEISLFYVVGCRRSGMTVVAELMSRYTGVVFVNEPRQLWIPLLPAMDIWSVAAPARDGRLYFAPHEALMRTASGQLIAQVLMDAYTNIAEPATSPAMPGSQTKREAVVVEKFQEHCFRLPFLAELSQKHGPGRCSFLHIIRDGVDVARSIASSADAASWYGVKGEWKWKCLREIILPSTGEPSEGRRASPPLPHCVLDLGPEFVAFLEMPRTDERCRFSRGLVEWAASILAARHGGQEAQDCVYKEMHYKDLMSNPAVALVSMLDHLDLEPSAAARQCARQTLTMKPSRSFNTAEREVLLAAQGSKVEKLLKEMGRELPF